MDAFSRPVLVLTILLPSVAAAKVTYDDDVLPIFEQACLNCHNPDKTKGGLDLSSFSGALKGGSGGKIVAPGDRSSTLIAVVKQTSEPKMPPEGDSLSSAHVEILEKWIDGGLLENKSSSARKPAKPKFDASIKSDPAAKPDGPPPMPEHLLLEPVVVAKRAAAIHAMAASPWAPLLAVTGQRQVLLFHSESLTLVGVLPFPEGDPVSLAFTPNARYLIVGGGIPGKSGRTVTFDVTNGERVLTAGKEFDTVIATDLHPSLNMIATGSPSKLIKTWKTEDGTQISSIKKHTDWVTALDYSPDGILLATGDRNGGVWVWESETSNEFHTLRGHQAGITAISFRADSNVMASASEDGSVRLWEMNQGKEIKKIDAHPGGVLAFSWARNGSFATAGRNRIARIWKPDFGQLREIKDLNDIPTAISLNAEGTRLFIGDYNGLITVHDTKTGDRLGQLNANPPTIETRITDLQKKISDHPVLLSKAKKQVEAKRSELEKKKTLRSEAESAAKKAKDAMGAAKRTLDDTNKITPPDPPQKASAVAALEKARKRSSESDQRLAQVRDAVKKAEESLAKVSKNAESAESGMSALKRQERHWLAAQLNAQALETTARVEQLELDAGELAATFTDSAKALEQSSNELARKRAERNEIAERLEVTDSLHSEELESVLAALDSTISAMSRKHQEIEHLIIASRENAEQGLAELSVTRLKASDLKKAYFSALKATP
ncbi:c-type cytochrome domain-containing protein [Haloferula sp.]|uniref:WD40 domain-containing protein n=1 Tax=Haloferula sp. TaxID=2497595 RepID=UPI00329A858C